MSNNLFYKGIPIERIDFKEEARVELEELEKKIEYIKEKLKNCEADSYSFQYWAIKAHDANKRLDVGQVILD